MFVLGALLLLAGQVALLAGTVAGKGVAYQHLAPWATPTPQAWPLWSFGVFAVQAVFAASTATRWIPWLRQAVASLGRVPALVLLVIMLGTGAALSRSPVATVAEAATSTALQLLQFTVLCAAAATLSRPTLTKCNEQVQALLVHPRTVPVFALFSVVAAATLALVSYERHPHIPDEVAYLFQARYLAAGKPWLSVPAVSDAFGIPFMLEANGKWFSAMPSGWAFLLALGEYLGAAWLVNPLLGGVNVWLVARVARALDQSPRTATLTAILLATSPWHLLLAMSLMSHTLALTLTLIATLCVLRARRTHTLGHIIAAGAAIGLVGINRPLEGLAVAVVLGCVQLAPRVLASAGSRVDWRDLRWRDTAWLAVATGVVSALVLVWNRVLTGDATSFPVMRYMDITYGHGRNALGFGPERGLGWMGLDPLPGHGPVDVVINALLNLFQIEVELFGWSIGSLWLALIPLVVARRTRLDLSLGAAFVAVVAVHSVYWFSGGPDFGARYWFLAIIPLVLLAARTLTSVELFEVPNTAPNTSARVAVLPCALLCIVLAMGVFVPWRAYDKYRGYRGMTAAVRPLRADPQFANALVLVRGRAHPDVASAAVYDSFDPSDTAPLFVWDRDADMRQRLARAYAQRKFFIVDGPSVTGAGYRVVAGPFDADAVLRGALPPDARMSSDGVAPSPAR